MRIDLSAVRLFAKYFSGSISSNELLSHPAYQTVLEHATLFGGGFCAADIDSALAGRSSPFPGLGSIGTRYEQVLSLAGEIERCGDIWVADAEREIRDLLPAETLDDIVVYPIVGYDIGIGLNGRVAMNLNQRKYLEEPNEFLYYMIHEATHVVFERHHPLPDIKSLDRKSVV